jgi:protein KRI1
VSRCGGSADPSYILNRGWIDKEKKAVPTYEDIVGRERGEDESDDEDSPWGKIDEEEDFDDKADEFETEYNFRFEEPGAATIVTHPRQIDSAVRRGDDTRKLKRQAREERKAAEKAAREEEVARKKDAKRREMEGQLNALRKELGDGIDLAGLEKVLEGDWDEAEWERVVGAMLAGDGGEDEDKPSWDDGLGDEYTPRTRRTRTRASGTARSTRRTRTGRARSTWMRTLSRSTSPRSRRRTRRRRARAPSPRPRRA